MLSQLFHSLSEARFRRATAKRRLKRNFRGQFEQLETRAMLTATIGSISDADYTNNSLRSSPDIYVVSVANGFILPPPNDGGSTVDSGETPPLFSETQPSGEQSPLAGPPLAPPPKITDQISMNDDWRGDPRMLPPPVRAQQVIFVGSAAAAAQTSKFEQFEGHETTLKEFGTVGSIGIWEMLVYDKPQFQKIVSGKPGDDYGVGNANGLSPLDPASETPAGFGKPGGFATADVYSSLMSTAAGQVETSSNISLRAYDAVYQSYLSQTIALTTDAATISQQSLNSIIAGHSAADDIDGGFVMLDGSQTLNDAHASRVSNDTIDTVLANLYDLEFLDGGQFEHDSLEHNTADGNTSANAIAAQGDGDLFFADSDQGGMVLIRTAADDRQLIASTPPDAVNTNWSVPEEKVQMDVTVGVYQAFDVASSELTSAKTSLPAAIIVPTKQHEQATRINVSADKDAKPTKDQASAWVEMFTAAAVVGATKRKRKTRSQA